MRIPGKFAPAFVFLLLVCGVTRSFGQWTTQTITLTPGWNAVYLEVQPANADCDAAFSGIPVESVWYWNRRFSSVQFIQDANSLVPGQPDWLTYLPADHTARATRNLFALQGASAYLIKLKAGAAQTTWSVKGMPMVRAPNWLPDSLNFVGFPISPSGTPTIQSFFSGSPAHAGQPLYQLGATGQWTLVSNPSTATMQAGRAYWVYCKGASTFSGPMQITLDQRDGLVYGRLLTEQTLRIRNNSSAVKSVTVVELGSQTPPASTPVLAGSVPLSYYVVDATNHVFGWINLPFQLQNVSLPPGQDWVLRLQVDRTQMANFVPPTNAPGVLYQSILQVTDDNGVRALIGVSSEGLTSYVSATPKSASPKDLTTAGDPRAGLWVGSATINAVSQPTSVSSPTNPVPVGTPLQFRLLVHVDTNGTARLLQKVLEMFKPGTLGPDPTNPSNNIVVQAGHYVLVTDDSLIPQFTGSSLRDSQPVARRVSTAVFGFPQPVPFSASGSFGTGSLSCQITLDYNDRLNPFKHLYHPDHDNLDESFQNQLPEGVESFTVARQIQFDFTAQDPDNSTIAGWGDDQLGGLYKEKISGLQNQPVYISGTFRLTRASTIGVLNDGL